MHWVAPTPQGHGSDLGAPGRPAASCSALPAYWSCETSIGSRVTLLHKAGHSSIAVEVYLGGRHPLRLSHNVWSKVMLSPGHNPAVLLLVIAVNRARFSLGNAMKAVFTVLAPVECIPLVHRSFGNWRQCTAKLAESRGHFARQDYFLHVDAASMGSSRSLASRLNS